MPEISKIFTKVDNSSILSLTNRKCLKNAYFWAYHTAYFKTFYHGQNINPAYFFTKQYGHDLARSLALELLKYNHCDSNLVEYDSIRTDGFKKKAKFDIMFNETTIYSSMNRVACKEDLVDEKVLFRNFGSVADYIFYFAFVPSKKETFDYIDGIKGKIHPLDKKSTDTFKKLLQVFYSNVDVYFCGMTNKSEKDEVSISDLIPPHEMQKKLILPPSLADKLE